MKYLRITIVQDRQDQPFYLGSTVTGNLSVAVNEPKSYKHIFIQFLGRAYVHWTKAEVRYSSSEVYIDETQTLWTADQSLDGRLPPGQHSFPFTFNIPWNVPSTFEGTVGSIRYELHGRIGRSLLQFDHQIAVRIPVQQVVGVSDPRLLQPVRQEVRKALRHFFRTSAPIVLTATAPKTGFCVGEMLPVHVYVENGSSCRVTLSASLCQSVVYFAEGRQQNSEKTLAHIESDNIAPHAAREWDSVLQVPATDLLEEGSCSNIRISHFLKITAIIPWSSNLSTKIPLKLGNVPEQPPPYTEQGCSLPTASPGWPPSACTNWVDSMNTNTEQLMCTKLSDCL